jgi:hypothetical protein
MMGNMRNIFGTVAKVGAAFVMLRILGFVILAAVVIWIISALVT